MAFAIPFRTPRSELQIELRTGWKVVKGKFFRKVEDGRISTLPPTMAKGRFSAFDSSPHCAGDGGKAPRPEEGEGVAGPAQRAQPYPPSAYFGGSVDMRPWKIVCKEGKRVRSFWTGREQQTETAGSVAII